MPLFYQQDINEHTRLGIWKIEEDETFFLQSVPVPGTIRHPAKRLQHLAGRYLLAYLFPGFPYHLIEIADTRKPYLPNEEYHFSISHCGEYAAAIISTQSRVGVDVEIISSKAEKVKHKFLHPEEMRFVNAIGPSQQQELTTMIWCAKEAMFKWYSYGEIDFSEMLRVFPFTLQSEGSFQACFIGEHLQAPLVVNYRTFGKLCLVYTLTAQ